MNRQAFTIVEMAIALAVTVVLMSIAIPRFNNLTTRQEFYSDAQALATCLQTAQSLALSNQTQVESGPARWIGSEIAQVGDVWSCRVVGVGAEVLQSSNLNQDGVVLTEIKPPVSLAGIRLTSLSANAVPVLGFGSETVIKLFFSSLERGVPAAAYLSSNSGIGSDIPAPGTGQVYSFTVQSAGDSSLVAQVKIQKTGSPISVVKQ